jgi:phosphoserine aminotransferase
VNDKLGRMGNLKCIPSPKDYKIDKKGGYLYYVDNETVDGIEFPKIPKSYG